MDSIHVNLRPVAILLLSGVLLSSLEATSEAQVASPLTSFGLNTQVSAPTPAPGGESQYNITGGTRPNGGSNLFHSFGKFDVPTNNIANFLNDTNTLTTNIMSRVTGGSPSNIFGTIQTTGFPGAHLFLMNPAGVIFGPTAQLNVQGSFHVSTADYVRLADGVRFTAVPGPQDALLSTAPVGAFGFLSSTPAPIAIQGSLLQVPPSQTLSIVGGDITIQGGTLSAPGGRIQLASVASPGEVVLFNNFSGANPQGDATLQVDGGTSQGQIRFFNDPAPVLEGNVHTIGLEASFNGTFHITLLAVNDSGKLDAVFPLLGPDYQIPAEQGKLIQGDVSSNLFFTFSRFDVLTGESATFLTPASPPENPITNILGRVGGGQPSELHGPINWFAGANLYFLNSSGVNLGVDARIGPDVTESFHVSTADYLKMSNGDLFIANPIYENSVNTDGTTNVTVLSSDVPTAFGFLSLHPAPITIQGSSLAVVDEKTISIIGGDITVTGNDPFAISPAAPSGRINIASVASPGELLFPSLDRASNINGQSFGTMGTVNVSSTTIDVSDASGIGAGSIVIRGGRLTLDNSTLQASTADMAGANPGISIKTDDSVSLANEAHIFVFTSGVGRAGNIEIAAETIDLSGASDIQTFAGLGDTGVGGDIVLNTKTLTVRGSSFLNTTATDIGSGGNIIIQGSQGTGSAATSVEVTELSIIDSLTSAGGSGGKVEISASSVVLKEGASLATNTASVGKGGGNIVVNASTFSLSSGAKILSHTDSTDSNASAGTVTIKGLGVEGTPADLVTLSGSDSGGNKSRISSDSSGAAPAGDIIINTKTLNLEDGGVLESGKFDASNAGNVTVTATTINMSNGSSISTAAFDKPAGRLRLSAPSINVDASSVQARAASSGRGGDIVVEAGSLSLVNGARLDSSTTGEGAGGTVTIRGLGGAGTHADLVAISGPGSGVFTNTEISVTNNTLARGGVINITADQVQLTNGSSIQASTIGSGRGGDIVMEAGSVSLVNGAHLDSSTSGAGAGGTVAIRGLAGAGTRADLVAISGQGSGLFTNTELSGPGGSINVQAGVVTVSDGGIISAESHGSAPTATGGLIEIKAGQVQLTNGGEVTAKSSGPANAGSVHITVDDSFESQGSSITTEARFADGGDIIINAGRLIQLTNSEVTSTVGNENVKTTKGGNISIDPEFVILDNSRILANAFAGTGGNINIVTGVLLVDPLSIIDASSALGVSGTVTIQSPISNLSETLAPLPQAFLRTGALLSSRCVARLGGPASSFVVAGRDAIPMEPGGLLPSPLHSFDTSASANSHDKPPTSNVRLGAAGLIALNLVGLDGAADCAP